MTRQVERQSGWRKRNSAPHIGCYLVIPASDAQEPSSAFESPDFGPHRHTSISAHIIPTPFPPVNGTDADLETAYLPSLLHLTGFEDEEKLFPTITFEGTCSAEFCTRSSRCWPEKGPVGIS
nr:hypothetical protein Iba_chr07cCG1770 [Ipomoea batatas]